MIGYGYPEIKKDIQNAIRNVHNSIMDIHLYPLGLSLINAHQNYVLFRVIWHVRLSKQKLMASCSECDRSVTSFLVYTAETAHAVDVSCIRKLYGIIDLHFSGEVY